MKKILAAVFLSVMALQAGAQGWTDALNFSENDYLGTARSVGMGNAMTAVGGDLGSLTFNPAGSAVASYSQFTITPGLSISTVTAQGSLAEGFEDRYRTRNSRMGLPNFGAMMAYDTRNKRGLKRVTFGIVGNVTRDYTNKLRASGTNGSTTPVPWPPRPTDTASTCWTMPATMAPAFPPGRRWSAGGAVSSS